MKKVNPSIAKLISMTSVFAVYFGLQIASLHTACGHYFAVDYPASLNTNEMRLAVTYTLWIPDGVKTLRGVIVHHHGAGLTASKKGSTAAYDLYWQALAKKWDYALLGPCYHVLNDGDVGAAGLEYWSIPGAVRTTLSCAR